MSAVHDGGGGSGGSAADAAPGDSAGIALEAVCDVGGGHGWGCTQALPRQPPAQAAALEQATLLVLFVQGCCNSLVSLFKDLCGVSTPEGRPTATCEDTHSACSFRDGAGPQACRVCSEGAEDISQGS